MAFVSSWGMNPSNEAVLWALCIGKMPKDSKVVQ